MKNDNSNESPNLAKRVLADVVLTSDSFSLVNGRFNSSLTSFAIIELNEKNFNDEMAHNLESFFNDKNIYADQFNVEYMGFLTGQLKLKEKEIEEMIPIFNEFLHNIC